MHAVRRAATLLVLGTLVPIATGALLQSARWNALSRPLKGVARDWFVRRAERKGIPWTDLRQKHYDRLSDYWTAFDDLRNESVVYPAFYTRPFHGYDQGNLNWQAAMEMEASAYSMTSAYWPGVAYETASSYVRGNFTELVQRFAVSTPRILDVGCATGISTAHVAAAFPNSSEVVGIDLSPHFLAVAASTCGRAFSNTRFVHGNAEALPFADDQFDLVTLSYVVHELPDEAAMAVLRECRRVLRPDGGVLAIVDLDPEKLTRRLVSPFRKWAFEATEPHVFAHYNRDVAKILQRTGFTLVGQRPNDPLNTAWVGQTM